MGISSALWGASLWTSLVYIVLNYPNAPTIDVKNDYRNFFVNLGHVLPCEDCQKNYCDHMKVIPVDNYLDGRPSLMNWLWRVHNQVNDFCGKPRITQDQFYAKYTKIRTDQLGGGGTSSESMLKYVAVAVAAVIIIVMIK